MSLIPTVPPNGRLQNRLVRLREEQKSGKGSPDKVLIDNVAGANNHDGGRVKFGPDGKIYWKDGRRANHKVCPRPPFLERKNPPNQRRRHYPRRQSVCQLLCLLLRPSQSTRTGVAVEDPET